MSQGGQPVCARAPRIALLHPSPSLACPLARSLASASAHKPRHSTLPLPAFPHLCTPAPLHPCIHLLPLSLYRTLALPTTHRLRFLYSPPQIQASPGATPTCPVPTSSPPNPSPWAIPTRSPTRSRMPSSTRCSPTTPSAASPAKRCARRASSWSPAR